MNQTTIKEPIIINNGVGLHSGKRSTLCLNPAPEDHGIVFERSDIHERIPATYQYAKPSPLCTTIEKKGVRVLTIEHLLSVCNGIGIDNLLVEIDCEEVPIMDGSGKAFFDAISKTGLKHQSAPRRHIKIKETISFQKGDITIFISPSNEINYTFSIDFDHEQIGQQEVSFRFNEKKYAEEIVSAKTFGFLKDISEHKKRGLIKGGTKKNAIILNEDGDFDNMEVLTWLNEPNLHKILDQIGDFYLANNMRIVGNVFSYKSGHSSHLEFIQYMMDSCPDKYEIIEED